MPIPAGSPREITSRWLASGEVGIDVLRLLLLGLLLVGMATAVSRQWLRIDLDRLRDDFGLPTSDQQDSSGITQWLIGNPKKSPPD